MRDEEALLDAWAASSQEGVFWIGIDNQIHRINHAALHLLDLPGTPTSWLNRPVWDLISAVREIAPDIVDELIAGIDQSSNDAPQYHEGQFENGLRTIHWCSQPIFVSSDLLGYLVVVRDITGVYLLNEMRHDLLGILEHDVQAPLQHVYSIVGALEEAPQPNTPQQTAYVRSLQEAQETMTTALGRLEALVQTSQLRSGELSLSPSAFALSELVEGILPCCRALAARRDLTVQPRLGRPLPMTWGDRELIQRVLHHLATYALEASAPGDNIVIGAEIEPETRGKIRVSIGEIAAHTALREGHPRYSSAETYSDRPVGWDSGRPRHNPTLAFCHTVLAAHGERIWEIGKPETGTVVAFTLPQVSPALQQISAYTA